MSNSKKCRVQRFWVPLLQYSITTVFGGSCGWIIIFLFFQDLPPLYCTAAVLVSAVAGMYLEEILRGVRFLYYTLLYGHLNQGRGKGKP